MNPNSPDGHVQKGCSNGVFSVVGEGASPIPIHTIPPLTYYCGSLASVTTRYPGLFFFLFFLGSSDIFDTWVFELLGFRFLGYLDFRFLDPLIFELFDFWILGLFDLIIPLLDFRIMKNIFKPYLVLAELVINAIYVNKDLIQQEGSMV